MSIFSTSPEFCLGLQCAILFSLDEKREIDRLVSKDLPLVIQAAIEGLRHAGLISIDLYPTITLKGHEFIAALRAATNDASRRLKSMPEDQVNSELHSLMTLGISEVTRLTAPKPLSAPSPISSIDYEEFSNWEDLYGVGLTD